VLRLPLRLIPQDTVLPILQGKLRGLKWIAGSSNHGCWLGSYEYHKRQALEKMVAKGSVVLDIGANAGFYTLLASVLVGRQGRVFAFEPVPRNLRYLKEHLRINGIANVSVIEAAVADCAGIAHFDAGPNPSMGHLAADGCLTVRTVSLDEMVGSGELLPPDCMKIDVEGAEASVLLGAKSLLAALHPTIFLATHGKEQHSTCCELLRSLGYSLEPISGPALDQTDEVLAYAKHRMCAGTPTC
jgi:FkbM family methyltransferase